jgi:hypothetical protein
MGGVWSCAASIVEFREGVGGSIRGMRCNRRIYTPSPVIQKGEIQVIVIRMRIQELQGRRKKRVVYIPYHQR